MGLIGTGRAVTVKCEECLGVGSALQARGAFSQAGSPGMTECLIIKSCRGEKVTFGLKPNMGTFNTKGNFLRMFYKELCLKFQVNVISGLKIHFCCSS